VYELFLLLPKLSLKGSARRAPRLHGRCILKLETAHRKGRTGAEALARVDSCAWDQSKRFAWDWSNALKRELQSTAKAPTLIDRCAWDQSKC